MAQVYGEVGALKDLRRKLEERGVRHLKSIREIQDFRKGYSQARQSVLNGEQIRLSGEYRRREEALQDLRERLELRKVWWRQKLAGLVAWSRGQEARLRVVAEESGGGERAFWRVVCWVLRQVAAVVEEHAEKFVAGAVLGRSVWVGHKAERLRYLRGNFQKLVERRSEKALAELARVYEAIEAQGTLIAGALGESRVDEELRKLPDDFVVLNDFRLQFDRPVYHKGTRQKIYSVQIDHLVLAPSGIFLLETKNWSQFSIESLDFRSPVAQIQRAGFAMYLYVQDHVSIRRHHWGDSPIPVRNVLVMTGAQPNASFKHLTVCNLQNLQRHLTSYTPNFTPAEVREMARQLGGV